MAEKRMFSRAVVESDNFLCMAADAQALYFHLSMAADDDGFVSNPRTIMRSCGASDDAMKILIARKFVLTFNKNDNFVVVIKHWRINNYIRRDTYHETRYKEFMRELYFDENLSYSLNAGDGHYPCISNESVTEPSQGRDEAVTSPSRGRDESLTQIRLDKIRLDKTREEENIRTREEDGFQEFWSAYPKKTGDIKQAWFEYTRAIEGGATLEQMLSSLEWQKKKWAEEGGQFVPSAQKWLANRGWTAQKPETPKPKPKQGPTNRTPYDGLREKTGSDDTDRLAQMLGVTV